MRATANSEVAARQRKREQIEMHERLAEEYARRYAPPAAQAFHRYWNRLLLRELGTTGGRVLDCGCGTGILLADLAKQFRGVHGVDLSQDMLRAAANGGGMSRLAVADAEFLPYPDGFFDAVVCRGTLHHMPDPAAVLRELRRVLGQGGRLVLSEPCNDSWLVRTARQRLYAGSAHFHEADEGYRSRELCAAVNRAGFEVLRMRRFGYAAYTVAGFPDVLPVLTRFPLAVTLTRALLAIDELWARVPPLSRVGLHVIVTARRNAA